MVKSPQGGAPPVIGLFIIPIKYRYIYHKPNLLEYIGVMFTNLANYGGFRFVIGVPLVIIHL